MQQLYFFTNKHWMIVLKQINNLSGYFDQQLRQNLFTTWSSHLQQAGLEFRQDLARTEVGVHTVLYQCSK